MFFVVEFIFKMAFKNVLSEVLFENTTKKKENKRKLQIFFGPIDVVGMNGVRDFNHDSLVVYITHDVVMQYLKPLVRIFFSA